MPTDKVIVVLERAEAEAWLDGGSRAEEAEEFHLIGEIESALDTDRGQWVKRIRAAIAAGRLRERGGLQTSMDTARGVLARIEEGANVECGTAGPERIAAVERARIIELIQEWIGGADTNRERAVRQGQPLAKLYWQGAGAYVTALLSELEGEQ